MWHGNDIDLCQCWKVQATLRFSSISVPNFKFDSLNLSIRLFDPINLTGWSLKLYSLELHTSRPQCNVKKLQVNQLTNYCQHICFNLFTCLLNFLPHPTTAKGHIIRTLVTENNTSKCGIFHQSIFNFEKCLTILSNCYCINFMP